MVGGVVYGASELGNVFALEAGTGFSLWGLSLGHAGSELLSSPAVAAGRLVLGTPNGSVYCLGETAPE